MLSKRCCSHNLPGNDFPDQCRDPKLFFKGYVGEELMNPFLTYINMENKYPTQVMDLRHQVDHITLREIQLLQKNNTDPATVNVRLLVILVRHRQIELISDGNRSIEIKVLILYIQSYSNVN